MATAGYSGTPLLKKLGLTPTMKVLLIDEPDNYFQLLETDISNQVATGKQVPDFIHVFADSIATFEKKMKKVLTVVKQNGNVMIWVSWYKKSSAKFKDLTEDMIRNYALQNDLVDVKVCAVSDEWSGLKLVVPVSKR